MDLQTLAFFGGLVALASHFFLIHGVWKGTLHLNIATWILWSVIDASVLFSSLAAGASAPFLSAGFVVGAVLVTITLFGRGVWRWGMLETSCAVLALACLGLWYIAGPLVSLISLTIGKYGIAGIPSVVAAYKNPERTQGWIWLMGTFGAATNIFTIGSWTLADSFFPTIALVFTMLIGLIHLLRRDEH